MKAGIYETPNRNLIYVRKDRTIAATTLSPSNWPGTKVSHRAKDDTALIEGTDYRCHRVGDLRNGENRDPMLVLREFEAQRATKLNESIGITGEVIDELAGAFRLDLAVNRIEVPVPGMTRFSTPTGDNFAARRFGVEINNLGEGFRAATPAAAAFVTEAFEAAEHVRSDLKAEGYRPCHSQSARKHRRQGHHVKYVPELGCYAWRPTP